MLVTAILVFCIFGLASSCVGSPMLSEDFQLVVLAVINLTLVPVNLNLNEGPILPSSVTIG